MPTPVSNNLPTFIPGQPIHEQLNADRMNQLIRYIRSITPRPGVGTRVQQTPGGTTIDAIQSGGTFQEPVQLPFSVTVRTNPNDETGGTFQAIVYFESTLMLSYKADDNLTITGLAASYPPNDDDDGWFDFLPGNDLIWLYVTIVDGQPNKATIQSYGQGQGGFDPTAFAWNTDQTGWMNDDQGTPAKQINFNVPIFFSTYTDAKTPVVHNQQMAFTNFIITRFLDNGFSATYVDSAPFGRYEVTEETSHSFECNPPQYAPFSIIVKRVDAGKFQAKVVFNSSLMKSDIANDTQEITGLDTFFDFQNGNDLIWVEATIDSTSGIPKITKATIDSWGQGGAWKPSDPPQEDGTGSGPFEYAITYDSNSNALFAQTKARIPIFLSNASGNQQLLSSHLIAKAEAYFGNTQDGIANVARLFLMPYAGPYVS